MAMTPLSPLGLDLLARARRIKIPFTVKSLDSFFFLLLPRVEEESARNQREENAEKYVMELAGLKRRGRDGRSIARATFRVPMAKQGTASVSPSRSGSKIVSDFHRS